MNTKMATGGIEPATTACTARRTDEYKEPSFTPPTTAGDVYRSRVWEDMRNLFKEDLLTDVMLAADGQSIPCHKVLLAAASKFFYDKFITNLESLEHNILDIDDIGFDTLTSAVPYIYSGNIELTVEKTEKLIPASVSLMLPELTKQCENFLEERKSDISDCIVVYRIAKANSLDDTSQRAWETMLDNFQAIITTSAFKELPETEVHTEVKYISDKVITEVHTEVKYISDKDLNVASEDPVFEAVVTWSRHDMENRKDKFEKLLENVTLLHCSLKFLGDVVMEEPLVKAGTNNCLNVAKALHQHASSPSLQMGTARGSDRLVYKTGRTSNALLTVSGTQYYIWRKEEPNWANKSLSMFSGYKRLNNHDNCSACQTGDAIVFTGGESYINPAFQCWKLSLPTLAYTVVSDLNVPRGTHASVCVGGQVYVMGGVVNSGDVIQSVEYLNEKTGSWCVITDMPVGLYEHTAVDYKHYIYVVGGIAESYESSGQSFVYDTVSKTWSRKADMPQDCTWGCSVVYRDIIYVLGGGEKCCMSYNPDQDQWQPLSRPREDHRGGSAVVWRDRILLCGGRFTTVIEEYNPHTDTWNHWKHSLPQEDCHAVLAVHL